MGGQKHAVIEGFRGQPYRCLKLHLSLARHSFPKEIHPFFEMNVNEPGIKLNCPVILRQRLVIHPFTHVGTAENIVRQSAFFILFQNSLGFRDSLIKPFLVEQNHGHHKPGRKEGRSEVNDFLELA
ncbi:MAG: hypothetical protein A4E69_01455 [Syntrophus sp. PtaB.Bin138]|nr:MAG: hypothetical protein A4E69_01455 [Syntrophus sp. PtaB.Bin138]